MQRVLSAAQVPRVPKRRTASKSQRPVVRIGTSYAQIVRALGEDNAKLAKCDRVTIDSIRNHTTAAFPDSAGRPRHL